jgi:hypothetical protein
LAYSNDQTQIRAGLVNYIGALIASSKFENKAAKQAVTSILAEETLKLAQDENGIIDLYTVKPMIRAVIFIFKQRIQELSKLPRNEKIETQKKVYQDLINTLEELNSIV